MSKFEWSGQQEKIFGWFQKPTGRNLVVRALAGTGKTSVVIEGASRAPERQVVLAAFNKHIAKELSKRIKSPNLQARTLHSIGFRFVKRAHPDWELNNDRGFDLARIALGGFAGHTVSFGAPQADPIPTVVVGKVAGLARFVKNVMPDFMALDPETQLDAVQDAGFVAGIFDDLTDLPLNPERRPWTPEALAIKAIWACYFAATRNDGAIDFDDMIWLPCVNGWIEPCFDLVVIDEAQDMNPTQLVLAQAMCRGRIAVVGDPNQAIYGFRGANSNAIDDLKASLDAVELPLTVTRRCPKLVVEYARNLVPDFEAAPEAPDGSIELIAYEAAIRLAAPGDFVISRLNAPLMSVALRLISAGKPAKILGRDIGKELVQLVQKASTSGSDPIDVFTEDLASYVAARCARLGKSEAGQRRARVLRDQHDTIQAVMEVDGIDTVTQLVRRIESMFEEAEDVSGAVVCATCHKMKGLESNRVFIIRETLYCYGMRLGDPEEKNIEYVAVTRTKSKLFWIGPMPQAENRTYVSQEASGG